MTVEPLDDKVRAEAQGKTPGQLAYEEWERRDFDLVNGPTGAWADMAESFRVGWESIAKHAGFVQPDSRAEGVVGGSELIAQLREVPLRYGYCAWPAADLISAQSKRIAALEEASERLKEAVNVIPRDNPITSGSPGPLYSAGWAAAWKHCHGTFRRALTQDQESTDDER